MSKSLTALLDLLLSKPLLTRKDLARRYNRSLRTIDQWHADGVLPKPHYLRGCPFPFWRPADILDREKQTESLQRAFTTARHSNQLSLFDEPNQTTKAAGTKAATN